MKETNLEELPLPPEAEGREICRIVYTPKSCLVFAIRVLLDDANKDPSVVWGILLVDLAHHVANALEGRLIDDDDEPVSRDAILDQIHDVFEAEWDTRTDTVRRITDS